MKLATHQIEIEGYISANGDLCIAFNKDDLHKQALKDLLIIKKENAGKFLDGLTELVMEIKNG